MKQEDVNKSALDLITTTSEVLGTAAGASAGFLAGGPGGAFLGGAAGSALARSLDATAHELQQRWLGPREQHRIGSALRWADLAIKSRLESGQSIRNDDFFQPQLDDRAAAEEVSEHVLRAAKGDPEEKKLEYYGYLLASLTFETGIDRARANFFIRRAEALSYRQLLILSVLSQKSAFMLRSSNYHNDLPDNNLTSLLQEIVDLNNDGLVILSQNNNYDEAHLVQALLSGSRSVYPARMFVVGNGKELCKLMQLETMQHHELEKIAELLR